MCTSMKNIIDKPGTFSKIKIHRKGNYVFRFLHVINVILLFRTCNFLFNNAIALHFFKWKSVL